MCATFPPTMRSAPLKRDNPCIISSRNNPTIRQIRGLRLRKERERSGLFFAEGIHTIAVALQTRAPIETLVVAPDLVKSPRGERVLERAQQRGIPRLQVTAEVFQTLADREDTQGVGMVAWQRWEALERTSPSYDLCWVALAGIQYPGNLGTILRVSDAVGGDGVILLGTTTDPYDPLSVRASKGAICTQRLVRASLPVFSDWKRRHNCTVIGTSPSAETDYRAFSYPLPVALLMGCERNGLTGEQQALCDIMVRIPMVGRCDSLNVAVAAGVMLYELFNQRHSAFSSGG